MTEIRYPAHLVDHVVLPGGASVTIRPVLPGDAAIVQAFVRGLSREARYNRFMRALNELSPSLLDELTRIDYVHHVALIATVEGGHGEVVIGEARYVVDQDPESCELAVAIADAFQGKGLAHRLAERLARDAAAAGIRHIVGHTLRSNDKMLHFARREGFSTHTDLIDAKLVRLDKTITADPEETLALREALLSA